MENDPKLYPLIHEYRHGACELNKMAGPPRFIQWEEA